MIPVLFSFFFPFLLVLALLQGLAQVWGRRARGWKPALLLSIVSLLIMGFPLAGLPLARWLTGLNANFSIPLTAILFVHVYKGFTKVQLLDSRGHLACWICSLGLGVLLYPMALGLGPWDPYGAGWSLSWLFLLTLALTLLLLLLRNPFSVVLLAALLAHNLGLLESANYWDYLVDPLLVLLSLTALARRLYQKARAATQKRDYSA